MTASIFAGTLETTSVDQNIVVQSNCIVVPKKFRVVLTEQPYIRSCSKKIIVVQIVQ